MESVGSGEKFLAVWRVNGFNRWLLRSDGVMTLFNTLAMGGNRIAGLANGNVDTDAVNLGQLNSAIATRIASLQEGEGIHIDASNPESPIISFIGDIGATNLNELTDIVLSAPSDGEVLMYNHSTGVWENQELPTYNNGDVIGPDSSTENSIPRFSDASGKELTGSNVTIDNDGNMDMNSKRISNAADAESSTDLVNLAQVNTIVNARTPKVTVGPTPPSNPEIGDLWIDTN